MEKKILPATQHSTFEMYYYSIGSELLYKNFLCGSTKM